MKHFKIRIAVIVFAYLVTTMSACGQGSRRNAATQRSADTTQVKAQTPQDAQKALAQLQQDFATGKITQEQLRQKMTEIMRGTTGQRQPANQMSAEEIQRRINEGQATVDETMKAYDEQLGNMSWPSQDAFKRFGYYVSQPEFDAPRGVRIRWELKQGKGEDGRPSETLEITVRKNYNNDDVKKATAANREVSEVLASKTLSPHEKLEKTAELQKEGIRLTAFTEEEALAVAKFVQSCGAGRCGEGGVSPQDCNYFLKPDPQRTHTKEWQYFIATEVMGSGGTIEIRIKTFANAVAQ